MKLFVGLGNPGDRYASSRHNIGFRIALEVARTCAVPRLQDRFLGAYGEGSLPARSGESPQPSEDRSASTGTVSVACLLPTTFMNASGGAVAAAVEALGLDPQRDLLVAFDDLDLPFGRVRLRPVGGAGGHNGVASIIDALGTKAFARLRFGIGRPDFGQDTIRFVLERFTKDEEAHLPAHVARAEAAALTALSDGIVTAMDRFNAKAEADTPEDCP